MRSGRGIEGTNGDGAGRYEALRIFPRTCFPRHWSPERKRQRSSFALTMIDLSSDLGESFGPWPMGER